MTARSTSRIARGLRLLGHLALGAVLLPWLVAFRRRATLVFTHWPDADAEGRDHQMGPLVDALRARGERLVEVALVTLDGGLSAKLARHRRPFLPYACLLALARLTTPTADAGRLRARRRAVARGLVALLRPRLLYLIDESGSGQMLLSAARSLGVRTIGVQHGDFRRDDPHYGPGSRGTEPADALGVWSPWFRERLLAISPIYTAANTRVVGRLRYPLPATPPAAPASAEPLRVLFLSEAGAGFRDEVAPFLEALRADPGLQLRVRPHPAEPRGAWGEAEAGESSLARALAGTDVAIGVGSSALLEALWHGVPAVSLATARRRDPAGLADEDLVELCERPEALLGLCRALFEQGSSRTRERRERVWGGAPAEPVEALTRLGEGAEPDPLTSAPPRTEKGRTDASRAGRL